MNDTETKFAAHRFLRVRAGVTNFAEVKVAFQKLPERLGVVLREAYEEDAGEGFVAPGTHRDWFDAGVRGATRIVETARRRLGESATGRIVVWSIRGTLVDTTTDAVEVAAAIATHDLLFPGEALPPLSSNPPWRIELDNE